MNNPESNESLVFNTRNLRLIVGALAFAFPATVIALTGGKVTSSISASYHEAETRDVFVGFLFIIGALLIAYKGHLQGKPKPESETAWHWLLSFKWIKVYQENIISTIGGLAAIFTALYPTNCNGCPINAQAGIHTTGAFILFSAVVYFSLFAFLRRVNQKVVNDNPDFLELVQPLGDSLLHIIPAFLKIASKVSRDYDENNTEQIAEALLDRSDPSDDVKEFDRLLAEVRAKKPGKLKFMWLAYEKKIARGVVYLGCGSLIALTLVVYLFLVWSKPDWVADSITTFVVETIALLFFGIAWMTASQLEYLKQILSWLPRRSRGTSTGALPGQGKLSRTLDA